MASKFRPGVLNVETVPSSFMTARKYTLLGIPQCVLSAFSMDYVNIFRMTRLEPEQHADLPCIDLIQASRDTAFARRPALDESAMADVEVTTPGTNLVP
jgi:hypothetical protein